MTDQREAQVVDAQTLRLKEPLQLPPGSTVIITIESPEGDLSDEEWSKLSRQGLIASYGKDEPEYPLHLIKEQNPDYQP